MFKTNKAIKLFAIVISLMLVAGISIFFACEKTNEKAKLRSKYPIIKESEYLLDDAALNFEERIAFAPSIVKIDIVEQLPNYTVQVEDKEIGISTDVEFCQYRVKLVSNISGEDIITDSGTFIIAFAKELEGTYPTLADNTTAICSIEAGAGAHTGKYLFFDRSFYYIDSDMALAAYDGDDSPAKRICSEKRLMSAINNITQKTS